MKISKICFSIIVWIPLVSCQVGDRATEDESEADPRNVTISGGGAGGGSGVEYSPKYAVAGCTDPDLSRVVKGVKMTLCDGSEGVGTLELLASKIKFGETIAGVTGALVEAPETCSSDGQQSCVTSGSYAAVLTTGLASKVVSTVSVAGVTGNVVLPAPSAVQEGVSYGVGNASAGTKFPTKLCRNGADLSTWDASNASNMPFNLNSYGGSVTSGTDIVSLNGYIHGLLTGDSFRVSTSGSLPGGLSAGVTYYAIKINDSDFRAASSLANALSNTAIDILSNGSGGLSFNPVADGLMDIWDTVDENNNNSGSPSDSPWGASYICDESNYTDVSDSAAHLTPSDVTPPHANSAFSEIWRDDLTGLYLSNVLHTFIGSWAQAMTICTGLDSGDGSGLWRLPTQKELMQLYVNGASGISIAGGGFGDMLSSTAVGDTSGAVWSVNVNHGNSASYYGYRDGGGMYGVICVR